MRTFITGAVSMGAALLLAGCSSSAASPEPSTSPSQVASSPTASPTPPPPATAKAMIRAIRAAQPAVDGVVIYTARTDENHLLGRPGGYESKGAWRDSRVKPSDTPGYTLGDIDVGGGIEVFSDREGALERGGRLQAIGPPIINEYDYACGAALLRVSGYLTPKQATQYRRQLAGILGVGCSPVA